MTTREPGLTGEFGSESFDDQRDQRIAEIEDKLKGPFVQLLKKYRKTIGVSQSKLAEIVDKDHSYISRLETGDRNPSWGTVDALAKVFGLDAAQRREFLQSAGFADANEITALTDPDLIALNEILNDESVELNVKIAIKRSIGGTALMAGMLIAPEEE